MALLQKTSLGITPHFDTNLKDDKVYSNYAKCQLDCDCNIGWNQSMKIGNLTLISMGPSFSGLRP
jgi:hypothetical protein